MKSDSEKRPNRDIQNIMIISLGLNMIYTNCLSMFAINEQFNYWIKLKGKIYSHPDNDKRVKIS